MSDGRYCSVARHCVLPSFLFVQLNLLFIFLLLPPLLHTLMLCFVPSTDTVRIWLYYIPGFISVLSLGLFSLCQSVFFLLYYLTLLWLLFSSDLTLFSCFDCISILYVVLPHSFSVILTLFWLLIVPGLLLLWVEELKNV